MNCVINLTTVFRMALGVCLCGLFTGCVTADQLAKADFGPQPTNPQEQVIRYFEYYLKDPDSAKYQFRELTKGYIKDGLIMGGKIHYGWIQVVDVNAKNSFGAYTGYQRKYIFFENGRIHSDATDIIVVAGMGGLYRN